MDLPLVNSSQPDNYTVISSGQTSAPLLLAVVITMARVLSHIWPCILLLGIISNIINIAVFFKAGAKDNVTVLLMALAMSDLMFLILVSTNVSGFVIVHIARPSHIPFDLLLLFRLLYWPAYTAYDLSTYISVSLGVLRCACVAMPLKFKSVFTKSRTVKWLVFLVFLAIALRLPVLMVHRVGWRTNPVTNISAPYLAIVNRDPMYRIMDILNRGVVIYLAYVTMVTCVAILSFKLSQTSKIRRGFTKGIQTSQAVADGSVSGGRQGLSPKDLQVVKSVILICSIFVLAQLPYVISATVRRINTAIDTEGSLSFVFGILSNLNATCSYLNASVNIFVYYNFNSKYRSTLLLMLRSKQ